MTHAAVARSKVEVILHTRCIALRLQFQTVARVEEHVAEAGFLYLTVVGVTVGEEVGPECVLNLIIVIMCEVCASVIFVTSFTVVHVDIHAGILCCEPSVRHLVRCPVIGVGSGEVVDVVDVAVKGDA